MAKEARDMRSVGQHIRALDRAIARLEGIDRPLRLSSLQFAISLD